MRQGLDQSVRNQAALAGSARGAAALAMAQQNAQLGNAMAAQQIAGQAGVLRSQEQMAAQDALLGGYSQMRGMDEGRALAQAQLLAQQRALNDQFQLGMTGYSNQQQMGNQQTNIADNQLNFEIWKQNEANKRYAAEQRKEEKTQGFKDILGGIQGGMSMGLTSGMGGK